MADFGVGEVMAAVSMASSAGSGILGAMGNVQAG